MTSRRGILTAGACALALGSGAFAQTSDLDIRMAVSDFIQNVTEAINGSRIATSGTVGRRLNAIGDNLANMSFDMTQWLPEDVLLEYTAWRDDFDGKLGDAMAEYSVAYPLQEKLADLELKIAALETAADPEALFLSYIDEALDDACSPPAIVVGNLVGVDGLDDIEQADDVVTLGDVLGEHCSEVNADCGKVLAEIYQGLVLPYCVGSEFIVAMTPVSCEIIHDDDYTAKEAVCTPAQLVLVKRPAYCVFPVKPALTYIGKTCGKVHEFGPNAFKVKGGDIVVYDLKDIGKGVYGDSTGATGSTNADTTSDSTTTDSTTTDTTSTDSVSTP